MTHRDENRDEVLRAEELLAALAMRHEVQRDDSPLYSNADVAAWLDQEASAPERAGERWSAERVRETAARIHAAVCARSARVRAEDGPPPLRPAAVAGTIPQVLDVAIENHVAPQLDLSAAAGVGRDLWDETCEWSVEIPRDMPRGRYIAVRIKGESMVPLFHTGDTLLVQLDLPPERGRVVLVQMPDGGYAAKKVGRLTRTRIELLSLNPDFAPVMMLRDERTVIGTVVLRWCEHRQA